MADVMLYKGGTPEAKYMWCGCHLNPWNPPFGHLNPTDVAPFHAKVDGAYGSGLCTFALGMPLNPKKMPWQKCILKNGKLAVGDFVGLIYIPTNHYVSALGLYVGRPDVRLAGATVKFQAKKGLWNTTSHDWEVVDFADLDTAVAAADPALNPLPLDYIGSMQLDLNAKRLFVPEQIIPDEDDPSNNYKLTRANNVLYFGFEVVTLPTDPTVTLDMMLNDMYFTIRAEGFESASHM